MTEFFSIAFLSGLLAASVRMATPLIFGTGGEMFSERAGILNLGIEGMMTAGAMAAFTAAYFTGSPWLGAAAGALAGAGLGLLMALLTAGLKLNQHVSGLAVTFFGTGCSYFFYRLIFGAPLVPPTIAPMAPAALPLLGGIPVLGEAFFRQYVLVYLAFLLVPLWRFFLFRTAPGLALRTSGENPAAADSAGISVGAVRTLSLAWAGALAGIGGAFLTVVQNNMFTFGTVAGRGWVCIALVVFARWMPGRVLLGALLFGLIDAVGLRLPGMGLGIPYQLFLLLPYLATVVLLVLVGRRAAAPAALLRPYRRQE